MHNDRGAGIEGCMADFYEYLGRAADRWDRDLGTRKDGGWWTAAGIRPGLHHFSRTGRHVCDEVRD